MQLRVVLSIFLVTLCCYSVVYGECPEDENWTASWTDAFGNTTYTLEAPCKAYIDIPFNITATVTEGNPDCQDNWVASFWAIIDNGEVIDGCTDCQNSIWVENGQWQKVIERTYYSGTPVDHEIRFQFTDLGECSGFHQAEGSVIGNTTVIYLTITTSYLPPGAIGIPYNQALTATGGVPPYTWSITSGTLLPNGLTLNNSTGVISGTPATEGTYSFIVQVMDTVSSTAIKNLSITIYLSQEDLPVKVSDSYYPTVQEAYDTCSDGDIIQIRDMDIYEEDIYFDHDVSITIKGGYNYDFTSNTSYTRIHGNITISRGTVVTENIIIQ